MNDTKSILRKLLDNDLITVKEWNEGLFIYVIYRIVWETKNHYILYAVNSEEDAKKIVNDFNSEGYYYEQVRIN